METKNNQQIKAPALELKQLETFKEHGKLMLKISLLHP